MKAGFFVYLDPVILRDNFDVVKNLTTSIFYCVSIIYRICLFQPFFLRFLIAGCI